MDFKYQNWETNLSETNATMASRVRPKLIWVNLLKIKSICVVCL